MQLIRKGCSTQAAKLERANLFIIQKLVTANVVIVQNQFNLEFSEMVTKCINTSTLRVILPNSKKYTWVATKTLGILIKKTLTYFLIDKFLM